MTKRRVMSIESEGRLLYACVVCFIFAIVFASWWLLVVGSVFGFAWACTFVYEAWPPKDSP